MSDQQETPATCPPTREQIAEAIDESTRLWWFDDQGPDGQGHEYLSRFVKDAVLALFPQPTPSAEPEHDECPRCKGYGIDPSVQRAGDMVIDCHRCDGTGEIPQPESSTAPPSIVDMAPETTFTRDDYPGEVWTVKRDVCDGGIYVLSDGHRSQNAEDLDPSTIRDVTPPHGD